MNWQTRCDWPRICNQISHQGAYLHPFVHHLFRSSEWQRGGGGCECKRQFSLPLLSVILKMRRRADKGSLARAGPTDK